MDQYSLALFRARLIRTFRKGSYCIFSTRAYGLNRRNDSEKFLPRPHFQLLAINFICYKYTYYIFICLAWKRVLDKYHFWVKKNPLGIDLASVHVRAYFSYSTLNGQPIIWFIYFVLLPIREMTTISFLFLAIEKWNC